MAAVLFRPGDAAAAFSREKPSLMIERQAVGFVAVFAEGGELVRAPTS